MTLSDVCIFPIAGHSQNLLIWAGHHRDVWEEHGALRRVLESCAGDLAPAVQLQHGDTRCNQCAFFRFTVPVTLNNLFCFHHVGRDSLSSLSVLKQTQGCSCWNVWAKFMSVGQHIGVWEGLEAWDAAGSMYVSCRCSAI